MLCPVYGHELTPLSCPPSQGVSFRSFKGLIILSPYTRSLFHIYARYNRKGCLNGGPYTAPIDAAGRIHYKTYYLFKIRTIFIPVDAPCVGLWLSPWQYFADFTYGTGNIIVTGNFSQVRISV